MAQGFKIFRIVPESLNTPKEYEVDPLEYVLARIVTSPSPLTTNEIEYLAYRAESLAVDEDLPVDNRVHFFDSMTRVCRSGNERARLNAFYVLGKINNVAAATAIADLEITGDWERLKAEFVAYLATLPPPPQDPVERAAWIFQRTVANPYLPPNMELLTPSAVMIGPAEQRQKAEAEDLNAQASAADERGDFDAAVSLWRSSLERYSTESAKYSLALALTRLERYNEAVPLLDDLCGRHPFSALYHSAFGTALRGAGDNDKALAMLDRALTFDPGRRTALINKGFLLHDLGRIGEAADILFEAAEGQSWTNEMGTENVMAAAVLMQCANHQLKHGQPKRAEELCRVGCEFYPAALPLWLIRIQAAVDLGHFERADELASVGCAAIPQKTEARLAVVELWAAVPDHGRMIRDLDLLLAEDEIPEALLIRARLTQHRLRDDASAATFYERYLAICPQDGDVWNDLGCTLQRTDEYRRARPCFEQAVRHRPEDPLHWTNLAGALLNNAQDGEDASAVFDCLRQAMSLDPQNIPAFSLRSFALARVGQFSEAAQCAQDVLKLDPDNTLAATVLVLCQQERGE